MRYFLRVANISCSVFQVFPLSRETDARQWKKSDVMLEKIHLLRASSVEVCDSMMISSPTFLARNVSRFEATGPIQTTCQASSEGSYDLTVVPYSLTVAPLACSAS